MQDVPVITKEIIDEMKKEDNFGITLIALVITIVLKRWCVDRYEKCRV